MNEKKRTRKKPGIMMKSHDLSNRYVLKMSEAGRPYHEIMFFLLTKMVLS